MRTRHALVTLVGLAVILLFALVVSASPPLVEPATFQDNSPTVDISLNTYNGVTEQGQPAAQYTFTNFQDVTCDINVGGPHSTAFNDPCYHRSEVYARGTTSPNLAGQCGLGSDRSFSKGDGVSRVIRYGQNLISRDCPVGLYTLKVFLMGSAKNEVATATVDFEVIAPRDPEPAPEPPTDTPTATPTDTPAPTPTDTPTATPTDTPAPTPTDTPTATPTDTPTATPTDTPTATPTDTPTATPTDTPTATPTDTPTATPTPDDSQNSPQDPSHTVEIDGLPATFNQGAEQSFRDTLNKSD